MQALRVLVVVMGVMIVLGVVGLGVLLARRVGGATGAPYGVLLDEPAGTAVAGIAGGGDMLGLQLRGGGADRVVVVDPRSGRVVGRIGLKP